MAVVARVIPCALVGSPVFRIIKRGCRHVIESAGHILFERNVDTVIYGVACVYQLIWNKPIFVTLQVEHCEGTSGYNRHIVEPLKVRFYPQVEIFAGRKVVSERNVMRFREIEVFVYHPAVFIFCEIVIQHLQPAMHAVGEWKRLPGCEFPLHAQPGFNGITVVEREPLSGDTDIHFHFISEGKHGFGIDIHERAEPRFIGNLDQITDVSGCIGKCQVVSKSRPPDARAVCVYPTEAFLEIAQCNEIEVGVTNYVLG